MAEGRYDHEIGSDAVETCFDCFLEKFEKVLSDSGIEGLQTLVSEKLEAWKTTTVNIAVVGKCGVGKSSFINAIRGLKSGDDDAALVGVVVKTKTVEHYAYPGHENILLWDLPEVGTRLFPKNEYEGIINTLIGTGFNNVSGVESFDIYLMLTDNRFTENDVWFVENIVRKYKKPYLFVRTKAKRSIDDDKVLCRSPKRDDEILDVISSYIKTNLHEAGFPCDKVYLIDNHCSDKFDFRTLKEDLRAQASKLKFGALVLSILEDTERIIESKNDRLKWRLPLAAVKGMNILTLEKEVALYKERLGLTEEAISRAARILGLDDKTLINRFDLNSCKKTTIEAYFKYHGDFQFGLSTGLSLGFTFAFFTNVDRGPLVSSMMCLLGAAAPIFKNALQFLSQMLIWCVEDAKKIQNAIIKSAADRCDRLLILNSTSCDGHIKL